MGVADGVGCMVKLSDFAILEMPVGILSSPRSDAMVTARLVFEGLAASVAGEYCSPHMCVSY